MREPVPQKVLSRSLFLCNVQCCFHFVTRFCYNSTIVLLLRFFYIFSYDFAVFNIICICFWIIAVLSEGILFTIYFYSLCNPDIFLFHSFVFNCKTGLENV